MSRYVDMPGHRGDISLGDVHILRSEFVVDLSDISHISGILSQLRFEQHANSQPSVNMSHNFSN